MLVSLFLGECLLNSWPVVRAAPLAVSFNLIRIAWKIPYHLFLNLNKHGLPRLSSIGEATQVIYIEILSREKPLIAG